MRFSMKPWMAASALALALAFVPASHAQVNSNAPTVLLNATLAESITVAAGPGTVTFNLVPNGPANGNVPVSITTSWALKTTRTSVKLYAYFGSATALTDGAGDNIPTSSVTGSINGAAAAPFTTATPFGANGLAPIFSVVPGVGTFNSSHGPDTIGLTINTTGLGLPAATYTGTLNVQAQAL